MSCLAFSPHIKIMDTMKLLEVMDVFITLIAVRLSLVYAYIQTN